MTTAVCYDLWTYPFLLGPSVVIFAAVPYFVLDLIVDFRHILRKVLTAFALLSVAIACKWVTSEIAYNSGFPLGACMAEGVGWRPDSLMGVLTFYYPLILMSLFLGVLLWKNVMNRKVFAGSLAVSLVFLVLLYWFF